jgi:hypothetical protein
MILQYLYRKYAHELFSRSLTLFFCSYQSSYVRTAAAEKKKERKNRRCAMREQEKKNASH